MSMMSSADENSGPLIPPDSPGSSVSTRMEVCLTAHSNV